jgi:hypothetical protein
MTSIIKVDNLQNQCGANIISESANVITIGASGDTVTLAAGASQSGFGRSGSVNWDTTKKTTGFTAVSGNGYFCDTTSAAFTVTLPASPSAGDIVAVADYNGTAITNNITVGRNSSNINGAAADLTINANYSAVTLVYVDATSGWRSVDSSNPNDIITLPEYVVATGGTITTCGDYKIHTFTGPGTFTVTNAGNPLGSAKVDYLVIAGGGSGSSNTASNNAGSGGGAGGFRESVPSPAAWTASPLANPGGALPVSVQGYPITVGGGGTVTPGSPENQNGNPGSPSIFSSITSTGGGGGGAELAVGLNGGSGGGAGSGSPYPGFTPNLAGSGNTPPTSPSQGNPGGRASGLGNFGAGGGGGAGGPGGNGTPTAGGQGGAGATSSINGTPTARGGGGGGGTYAGGTPASGGSGGGGNAGPAPNGNGLTGSTNTGGGGGGSAVGTGSNADGGTGGSGIVIIRYKYQ